MSFRERLYAIPWRDLQDAYGPAEGIPEALLDLESKDAEGRAAAIDTLYSGICHQSCTIYEATAPAVPFLIELAGRPKARGADAILILLGHIVSAEGYLRARHRPDDPLDAETRDALAHEEAWVKGCRSGVWRGLDVYLRLLQGKTRVRMAAVYVLAALVSDAWDHVPVEMESGHPLAGALATLKQQLGSERDPAARANVVMALGAIGLAHDTAALLSAEFEQARSPLVRLAAALRLIDLGISVPGADDVVFDALADPGPFAALADLPWHDTNYGARAFKSGLPELERRLPRILEMAATCVSSLAGQETVIPLIDRFFPSLSPPRTTRDASGLTLPQRQLLLATLDNPVYWARVANARLPLETWGLPKSRRALRALLAGPGGSPAPPDPAATRRRFGEIVRSQLALSALNVTPAPADHPSAMRALEEASRQAASAVIDFTSPTRLALDGQTEDVVSQVSSCPNLRVLDLFRAEATDANMHAIGTLTGLIDLDLTATQVSDAGAAHLARLTSLKRLRLLSEDLGDEGLRHLAGLEALEELYLGGRFRGKGLAHLARLVRLRKLSIANGRNLSIPSSLGDDAWEPIGKLRALEELEVHGRP